MSRKRVKSILWPSLTSVATDSDISFGRGGSMSKFRLSRLGRKLHISDDPRTVLAMPKEVPERTWAEIFQKEENELVCFEIREEILEAAMGICYEDYMERQTALFTVHCAAAAILKIIDWHFYRHDPGEDPSAYPPCYIPKRQESWIPDSLPESSMRDSWSLRHLRVAEHPPEESLPPRVLSPRSMALPVVEPIPEEFWFPGKVNLTTVYIGKDGVEKRHIMAENLDPRTLQLGLFERVSELYSFDQYDDSAETIDRYTDFSSEMLQKVTDYSSKDSTPSKESKESKHSSLKLTTPVDGSLQGAGDSTTIDPQLEAKKRIRKSKSSLKGTSLSVKGRLPPLVADSLSHVSRISDCRLRNLRLDTHYEIASEKVELQVVKTKANMKKKKGQ
ncbi:hypothetical protein NE865_12403 [Phthorimaea operculella]|nr:hypothetical protein NE865_12403 [Phthorimaea operculella]